MDFFTLVSDVGFPIAGAIAAGAFVFITLKFILASVTGSVNSLKAIIGALDNRVQTIHVDNSVRASVIARDLETGETKPSISATQSVIPKQGFFPVNLKDEIGAW